MDETTRIEPIPANEWRSALARIVASRARVATASQIAAFSEFIEQSTCRVEGIRTVRPGERTAEMLVLHVPGGTAVLMFPSCDRVPGGIAAQARLIRLWQSGVPADRFHFVQVLIEPDSQGRRDVLLQSGFERITRLFYLDRKVDFPWTDPPDESGLAWRSYSACGPEPFEQILESTYEASLDCPELTGTRPIGAVLEAHKASGVFDPELWEIAERNDAAAGCILLALLRRGEVAEVVYMGVARDHRRTGVGGLLLRRALEQCRARRIRQLSIVVDERNTPARRLYSSFSFVEAAQRDAYILRW